MAESIFWIFQDLFRYQKRKCADFMGDHSGGIRQPGRKQKNHGKSQSILCKTEHFHSRNDMESVRIVWIASGE